MSLFQTFHPALLIIDVQHAIDHMPGLTRSHIDAEEKMTQLLLLWRRRGWPVVHVRHSSKFDDSPYHSTRHFAIKREVMPQGGEPVITKRENCAFLGTNLENLLKKQDARELVVCGVLLNNSVDATVRVACGLGFEVTLVGDATPAGGIDTLGGKSVSAEAVHDVFLSNLSGEYCRVVTTDELLND